VKPVGVFANALRTLRFINLTYEPNEFQLAGLAQAGKEHQRQLLLAPFEQPEASESIRLCAGLLAMSSLEFGEKRAPSGKE